MQRHVSLEPDRPVMTNMAAAARHIALEGSSNLRDVGGYHAAGGRRVRWNLIYRSGALARLTDADWQWMRDRDIGAVCDLRSDHERELTPTIWRGAERTRHVGVVYDAALLFGPMARVTNPTAIGAMGHSLYPLFSRLLAPTFRAMFEALLAGDTPIIVHCSAGQDRTGLAIALVLTALGVPRETILEDFLMSTALRRVENEIDRAGFIHLAETNMVARYYAKLMRERGEEAFRPRALVDEQGMPLLLQAFAAIEVEYGSIEGYLDQALGITAAHSATLRDICLE